MLGVVTLGVRPLLVMPASGHPERPTAQVRESPAPDHELPMGAGAACEKRETPEHIEIGKYYLATCSNPLYSLKIRDPSLIRWIACPILSASVPLSTLQSECMTGGAA